MTLIKAFLCFGIIVSVLFSEIRAVEYFIYFPDVIIPGAVHTIPVYVSNPPVLLTFSHSVNGSNSHHIKTKYSYVPFSIDNLSNNDYATINVKMNECLGGMLCGHEKVGKVLLNKTYQIPLSQNVHLLNVLTSKPCYTTSETVKIVIFKVRLEELLHFPDYFNKQFQSRNLMTEPLTINLYRSKVHLRKTWVLNVTEKFVVLDYKIPEHSMSGTWKIEVLLNKRLHSNKYFKVTSKRVSSILINSKIKIKVLHEDDFTIVDKHIKFSVCAQYSRLRAVEGNLRGEICALPQRSLLGNERPCIKYNSTFDGSDLCVTIEKNIKRLDLRNISYANSLDRLIIKANVFDDVSRNQKSTIYIGPALENSKYRIHFLSELYFKSNLPYYGKIQISKHNGKPFPNASIIIQCNTVNFPYSWGHFSNHTSDYRGLIHFILSPPPSELTIITCDIEDRTEIEEKFGIVKYYRPTITQSLEKWKSNSESEIQLRFIRRTLKNKTHEVVSLKIQGNRVFDDDLVLWLLSNGFIIRTNYFSKGSLSSWNCKDRDDELGHYTCNEAKKKIVCRENWQGNNCLVPRCVQNCKNGICIDPRICTCKYGWKGELCDVCIKNKNCVNGFCEEGNDCTCQRNWTGINCNIKMKEGVKYKKAKSKTVKRDLIENSNENISNPFIYTTNIDLEIPVMVNEFSFLLHSLSKYPLSSKITLEPFEIPLRSVETNELDINNLNLSSKTMKCMYGHSFKSIKSLFGGDIISVNDSSENILRQFYNSIISSQCELPFNEKSGKGETTMSLKPDMISEGNQLQSFDLLYIMETLKLMPISSLKMVIRTCPMWKIFEVLKSKAPEISMASKIHSKPSKTSIENEKNTCDCVDVCKSSLFYNIKDLESHLKPYRLSSLCFDLGKTEPISAGNLNLNIKPIGLVTIGTIKYMKVDEVHHIPLNIVKKTKDPLEVEITIEATSKCINKKFPTKIFVLLNETKFNSIKEKLSFSCAGTFTVKFTFEFRKWSKIFPNLERGRLNNTITKTEYVVYTINEGIYQQKTFSKIFCLWNQSSKARLTLPTFLRPNRNVKLNVNIQNSVDCVLNYIKYFYINKRIENILKLTMKVYEMNLNKIQQKDRSYLNQSLINIKKLLLLEANALNKGKGVLSSEYRLLLASLCGDIPNHLYPLKMRMCSYIQKRVLGKKVNEAKCYKFDERTDEVTALMLLAFLKQTNYIVRENINILTYLRSCHQYLNVSLGSGKKGNLLDIMSKSDNDLLDWIHEEKDDIRLAVVYFHFKENNTKKVVLSNIVERLLRKVAEKTLIFSPPKVLLLLKIFYDFELRFGNRSLSRKEHSTTSHIFRSLSKWSGQESVEMSLPIINTCSVATLNVKYYQNYVHKDASSSIKMTLDKGHCTKGSVTITFGDHISSYDSLVMLCPSGWAFDFRRINETRGSCGMVVAHEDNYSIIQVDLRMVNKNCTVRNLFFSVYKYQNVTNYSDSYGALSTDSGIEHHLSYKVPTCGQTDKEKVYVKYDLSKKQGTEDSVKDFCQNEHFISMALNKKDVRVYSNSLISISNSSSGTLEKLSVYTVDSKKYLIEIDRLILWSLNTTSGRLCNVWKVVKNVLANHNLSFHGGLTCQTGSIDNVVTLTLLCRKHMYAYKIVAVNMEKKEVELQYFRTKCETKISSDIFKFQFSVKKKLSTFCSKTLAGVNSSQTTLLLSRVRLTESRGEALMFSNDHFILQL